MLIEVAIYLYVKIIGLSKTRTHQKAVKQTIPDQVE